MPFTPDKSSHKQCFNVTINDDKVVEAPEMFSFNLSLTEGSNVTVVVIPDIFNIEIMDEDGNVLS